MAYGNNFNARVQRNTVTPQVEAIAGREDVMVRNRAGGMVFELDCWARLRRFLILGSDSPTYYANADDMTLDNIEGVLACLRQDGLRTVREIVAVSEGGLAPKNDPALYALALASAYGVAPLKVVPGAVLPARRRMAIALTGVDSPLTEGVRRAAFAALPRVARTGTHLLQFVGYMETLRGWGLGARNGIKGWMDALSDENLALQAVKYRQRGGWELRDIYRLSHVPGRGESANRRALVDWIVHREVTPESIAAHDTLVRQGGGNAVPARRVHARRDRVRPGAEVVADARARYPLVDAFHQLQEAARIIRRHSAPRECVPTEFLNSRDVWDALLVSMPPNATIRNLNKMTSVGLIEPGSEAANYVARLLVDEDWLRRARVHPFNVLVALKTYAQGHGVKGRMSWTAVPQIVDALDAAFYASFKTVRPTGLRVCEAIDVSASMDGEHLLVRDGKRLVDGPVSAREAAAALAMVTNATEQGVHNVGFTAGGEGNWSPGGGRNASGRGMVGVTPIDLSARRRLDDVCRQMRALPMGRTDCALPVLWALANNLAFDLFVVRTDNETYAGQVHLTEALRMYRDATGIQARLVACGMTSTSYSVADPKDPLQMDMVGFDASGPAIIADFGLGGRAPGRGLDETPLSAPHGVKARARVKPEGYVPAFAPRR